MKALLKRGAFLVIDELVIGELVIGELVIGD